MDDEELALLYRYN